MIDGKEFLQEVASGGNPNAILRPSSNMAHKVIVYMG